MRLKGEIAEMVRVAGDSDAFLAWVRYQGYNELSLWKWRYLSRVTSRRPVCSGTVSAVIVRGYLRNSNRYIKGFEEKRQLLAVD